MKDALQAQIEADLEKERVEFEKDIIKKYRDQLINYSRKMWTYRGLAGSLTPWHDNNPEQKLGFSKSRENILNSLKWMSEKDISLEAYAVFALSIYPAKNFKTAAGVYSTKLKGIPDWIVKLRKHAGSSSKLDLLARVLLRFFELQVEAYGVIELNPHIVVQHDRRYADPKKKTKCLEQYHQLGERVFALDEMGICPILWLEQKFQKTYKFLKEKSPRKKVSLQIIVNRNGLEPDLRNLKAYVDDPWRPIKEFLGLSELCEFTDGYIPKGWGVSSDDRAELSKVRRITGLGYYFYENGTQRRGRRHYAHNSYFVIKCTPENFELFKSSWHDPRLITAAPTWEEYSKWGASSGWWDELGNATNGRGRPVKWRKDGSQKSK